MTEERIQFRSPLGGVMTREVGTISGDLEVWLDGRGLAITYVGALDTYHVKGKLPKGATVAEMVAWLSRDPGIDEDDNPECTSLEDFVPGGPAAGTGAKFTV